MYKLCGVVVHKGVIGKGHYVSFVRVRVDRQLDNTTDGEVLFLYHFICFAAPQHHAYLHARVLKYINTEPYIGTNNRIDVDMNVVTERYEQLEMRKNNEHGNDEDDDDDAQFECHNGEMVCCCCCLRALLLMFQFHVGRRATSSNIDEHNDIDNDDDDKNDVWYEMSDTNVKCVDECVVLKQEAYMLFYERQ
jgi:hypothetical protein